jgi:hypothetical protein
VARELERRPAVDPAEEPSAEWGWHGSFPKAKIAGAVLTVLALFAMAWGPYQSRTQDLWLAGVALLLLLGVAAQVRHGRRSWRR